MLSSGGGSTYVVSFRVNFTHWKWNPLTEHARTTSVVKQPLFGKNPVIQLLRFLRLYEPIEVYCLPISMLLYDTPPRDQSVKLGHPW